MIYHKSYDILYYYTGVGEAGKFTFCLFVVMIKEVVIWAFVVHEDQFDQGILYYEPHKGVIGRRKGKMGELNLAKCLLLRPRVPVLLDNQYRDIRCFAGNLLMEIAMSGHEYKRSLRDDF